MIEINEIFSDSDKRIAWWCDSVEDTNDLAKMADDIIKNDIHLISLPSDMVESSWVYLEKFDVKILSRFYFSLKNIDSDMYELATDVTKVCKQGADGVQIFVSQHDLEIFTDKIVFVRDDLFFGHDLSVVMDIEDLDINNWAMIFQNLRKLRVKAFCLTLKEDTKNRSDFVGRVYSMFQNWNADCELHFMLNNNFERIDQVIRLAETERPELSDKLRFFLDY